MIILERELEEVSAASLARFARRAQKLTGVRGEVSVLVAGNRRLKTLNRTFRGKDRPTDVLSFPRSTDIKDGGDIAVSADIARQNATLYRHSHLDELRILILHGMLHLAGHDHETDGGQMAKLEARLRSQLRLPASLIQRASPSHRPNPALKKRVRKPARRRSR